MTLKTVNSEEAMGLIYALFQKHPWLNKPGPMQEGDAAAEQEALAFLVAGDFSKKFRGCSPSAKRVVCTLLLDFISACMNDEGFIRHRSWQVDASLSKPDQALALIADEIGRSHPHLRASH